MVRQCCKCKKLDFLNPGVFFYKFPKELDKRKTWITSLGLKKFLVPKTADVCSDHFNKADIIRNARGFLVLKNNVVPKSSFDTHKSSGSEDLLQICAQDNSELKHNLYPGVKINTKSEGLKALLDNESTEEIKVFYTGLESSIKSEHTYVKEEQREENENSFDILPENQMGLQVKDEPVDTTNEIELEEINLKVFDSDPVKNEEVIVKEDPVEVDECSSPSNVWKSERVIEASRQFQSPLQLLYKDKRWYIAFKCSECDYSTPLKSHMNRHLTRHKKIQKIMHKCGQIKPHKYSCDQCDTLYQCRTCDFRTPDKGYLTRHIIRHNFEKCIKDK